MKINKEKLGKYIHPVDEKNYIGLDYLLGVSNDKKMMPSIANINGTDLSSYKVVKNNQFVYGPVTSRNGDKISISLYQEESECIVSSSYTVFELDSKAPILSEFLYLWFIRPEFDRYARYMSHGSVREIFSWESLCNVEIPIPSIEEQEHFINNFNTINKYIDNIQQQNSYMVNYIDNYFNVLYKDCEKNSTIEQISKKVITGGTPSTEIDEYWNGDIPFLTIPDMHDCCFQTKTERTITLDGLNNKKTKELPIDSISVSCIGTGGLCVLTTEKCITNQQINSIVCKDDIDKYFILTQLHTIKDDIINAGGGGTVGCNLNASDFKRIKLYIPSSTEMKQFGNKVSKLYKKILINEKKLFELHKIHDLYLTKLANM